MRTLATGALLLVGALAASMAVVSCLAILSGCASAPPPDPQAVSYGAELQACVFVADTRAQADACMARVRAKYGRDGGT